MPLGLYLAPLVCWLTLLGTSNGFDSSRLALYVIYFIHEIVIEPANMHHHHHHASV